MQLDLALKAVRAETAGGRTSLQQVKDVAVQRAAGLPYRVVRRGFAAELFGFAPLAAALLRCPFHGQMEHGFVSGLDNGQAVHKLIVGAAGQAEGGWAVRVFQTVQPVADLVFGVAQGPLFFHLGAALQHLGRRPLGAPFFLQGQALHRSQNAQSRTMFAVPPHRAGAATAPLAQVATRTDPKFGIDRIGLRIVALDLALQAPAVAIGRQLGGQDLVLQIQGGAA